MKNNEYKKYFDQVSPDQNLIEQTRKKMYEQLNNTSAPLYKSNGAPFIRYSVLAACAAIAAVTVAVVPKPVNTNINQPVNSDNQADVLFTDTERTSVTQSYVTTPDGMTTDYDYVSGTQQNSIVHAIATSASVLSSNDHNSNSIQSQINQQAVTGKTTYIPDHPKHTVKNTTAPKQTIISINTTPKSDSDWSPSLTVPCVPSITNSAVTIPVTDSGHPVTTPDVTMPCVTVNSNAQVTPVYRPGSPPATDAPSTGDNDVIGDEAYYIAKVETDGYTGEVNVNIENEYYNHHYTNTKTVSVDDVNNYFGKDICPQVLKEQYPDFVIKTDEYAGMGDGTAMIFGASTGLYVSDSKFVIISAAKRPGTSPYEYMVDPPNPISTTIDGNEYVLVTLSQYPDTFFCSYQKDGLYYSVCFKGYSITDVVNLLLSF